MILKFKLRKKISVNKLRFIVIYLFYTLCTRKLVGVLTWFQNPMWIFLSFVEDLAVIISSFNIQGFPEILQGISLNQYTRKYAPPFDEFEVDRCILPQAASVSFPSVPGPSLFLVISGKGTILTGYSEESTFQEGEVLFVPAYMEVSLKAASTELHMYRAGVNSRFFWDLDSQVQMNKLRI